MHDTEKKDLVEDPALKKILDLIHQKGGIDLGSYRQNFILRRLNLRLQATKSKGYPEYLKILTASPEEISRFLDNLSVNVTEFFRDREVFDLFRKEALRNIIAEKEKQQYRALRLWSAGCANGEETYSLAILVNEELQGRSDFLIKIWGTDIDEAALSRARQGEYETEKLKKIDTVIFKKYFSPAGSNTCRLSDKITKMVEFKKCNLADDPPFKHLDAIFCRNVMIYLSRQQKDELFKRFHRLLNTRGYLVLSKVETLWERNLFNSLFPKEKIYQKIE